MTTTKIVLKYKGRFSLTVEQILDFVRKVKNLSPESKEIA